MRSSAIIFSLLAASVMMSAIPIGAAETMVGQGQKDECLLVAHNCIGAVDSIQQRIERLGSEIARGSAVYSSEELRSLNNQLDEAHRLFNSLMNDGSTASM